MMARISSSFSLTGTSTSSHSGTTWYFPFSQNQPPSRSSRIRTGLPLSWLVNLRYLIF